MASSEAVRLSGEIERVVEGLRMYAQTRETVGIVSLESPDYFVYVVTEKTDPERAFLVAEKILPPLKKALFARG